MASKHVQGIAARLARLRGRLAGGTAAASRRVGVSTARGRRAHTAGAARPARGSPGARAGRPARGTGGADAGRLAGYATAAGRRVLAAARGETAGRLGRLAAITVALVVLVAVLYEHGDVPTAAARPVVGDPRAAAAPAAPGRPETRPGGGPRQAAPADGRAGAGQRPLRRAGKPAEVAAAWYANRHGLRRSRVRPLQQDRLSARRVRVLVLADAGNGHLRTALVEVRLGPSGWEVR
jgi:hypothetical protein